MSNKKENLLHHIIAIVSLVCVIIGAIWGLCQLHEKVTEKHVDLTAYVWTDSTPTETKNIIHTRIVIVNLGNKPATNVELTVKYHRLEEKIIYIDVPYPFPIIAGGENCSYVKFKTESLEPYGFCYVAIISYNQQGEYVVPSILTITSTETGLVHPIYSPIPL